MNSPVGLIGLGLLGTAIAQRLQRGGIFVLGYDTRHEACRQSGLPASQLVASVEQVVAACRRVILCLPDSHIVEAVLATVDGALQPGDLLLDTTTGDPDVTVRMSSGLAERGIGLLDVSVLGSSEHLREGTAVLLAGGTSDQLAQCRDLLDVLSPLVHHTGAAGSGQRMKLVANLALGLNRAVLAETLAFAASMELDLPKVLAVLKSGLAYSRVMDTKGQRMVERQFAPQARLSQHLKDVRLIRSAATVVGQHLPLSELHQSLLERAEAMGLGDLDNSAICQVWDH